MVDQLKQRVCDANVRLVREGLVLLTWGNASAVDRAANIVVIKPSGVSFDALKPEAMVVVSLSTGEVVNGNARPSSDTPTHLALYRAWPEIGGIVHTHSLYGTAWAQAGREIPVLGTTHADHFSGPIPVTRALRTKEIAGNYEMSTGAVIVERFRSLEPLGVPGVLVRGHAPFAWGESVEDAVKNAVTLERVAQMATLTMAINRSVRPLGKSLIDKHFARKHGPDAYYGQPKK